MQPKMWRRIGVAGALLTVLGAVGFQTLRGMTLEIELLGDSSMIVEYGEHYQEPGVQLWLCGNGRELSLENTQVATTGNVVEDRVGLYTITYEVSLYGWGASAQRQVAVVDTQSPVIELFSEEGKPEYRAVDNYDGDITEKVIRKEERGLVTYAVTDSSGNPASAQREVPYVDTTPPEIRLEGGETCSIIVGQMYAEPGYTAWDDTDGDITEWVTVEGEVDRLTPGIYPIQYRITDSSQNETVITRNVEVQAKPRPNTQWPEEKTIYLTFDDGPGPNTEKLLDVLDRYGVHATFFVVDSEYRYLLKEIVARGHSIGIHSRTHNYGQIYASQESYMDDLLAMQEIIYENTGVVTTLMRFPGGGSNLVSKRFCRGIMSCLTETVQNAGFQYFDWNVDSDDAGNAHKTKLVRDNVIRGIQEKGTCMVLQHDTLDYSVNAVEDIIVWALEHGYTFRGIRNTTPGFHHNVAN